MAIQQLTQTDSFTIEYDDVSPSALRRAGALARTVERDAATMFGWFGVANPLNPANRCTVKVAVNAGLGDNYGYQNAWFGTLIEVSPLDGAADQDVADDFARAIFAAEFAEVLMDVRNGVIGHSTWNGGDSAGEALSTICAEVLYQDACLRSGQGYPRGQFWLQTPGWPDFVSNIDGTDQHFVTFGCGILFIAFLMGQLTISLDQIIQAEGQTLEEKFHALTGRSGGYSEMTGVLSQFFTEPASPGDLRTDFPFPLFPASQRSLSLSVASTIRSSGTIASGQVLVTLPFPCQGTVEADYTVTENSGHLRLLAMPNGFASPSYQWFLRSADGTAIPVGPEGSTVTVQWNAVAIDPANPSAPPPAAEPLPVNVTAAAPATAPFLDTQAAMGVLELDVSGGLGTVTCSIECRATEAVSPGLTSATAIAQVLCRQVHVDDTDLRVCQDEAFKVLRSRLKPNLLFQIMPDPPPDFFAAISAIGQIAALAQDAAKQGDNELVALLRTVASGTLGIPDTLLQIGKPAETR